MAIMKAEESDKILTDKAGIMHVANILDIAKVFDGIPEVEQGSRGPVPYLNKDILKLMTVSLATGNNHFVGVDRFKDDGLEFYLKHLGVKGDLPAESTVRTRINALGPILRENEFALLNQANIRLLKAFDVDPGALPNGMVPLDCDVTPCDNSRTKKEGCSMTYKMCEGYAPMMSYLGTKGFFLGAQFRAGSVHSQKGMPEHLAQMINTAKEITSKPILVRLDSGNDARDNMFLMADDPQVNFIIKHNLRGKDKDFEAFQMIASSTQEELPRVGKTVYTGSTYRSLPFPAKLAGDSPRSMTVRVVFQVSIRDTLADGQVLLYPESEIDEYYTFLSEEKASDEEVISLYHDHGTCEQFHSELKTDLDIERFPSGKFATNALILQLEMLAFNSLRVVEYLAREMPVDASIHYRDTKRRRIKTILDRLILVPALMVTHARKSKLYLGKDNPWSSVFIHVNDRIAEVGRAMAQVAKMSA